MIGRVGASAAEAEEGDVGPVEDKDNSDRASAVDADAGVEVSDIVMEVGASRRAIRGAGDAIRGNVDSAPGGSKILDIR